MADSDVLTEVPAVLKNLARSIVRGFYGPEHAIVIDLLVRNPCMKEEDLLELLKFERKQLRAVVNTLKCDKLLKVRMRMETDEEGKTSRHNYYFINYKLFVNIVKYKLDHMRRKIEMEERDNTSRASFKCPDARCLKTFTDLEADQLFDFITGTFKCTHCGTEVIEDESFMPKKDARTLLARFNEQIQPVYDLLQECEDIKLAPEILEPEPMDIRSLRPHGTKPTGDKGGWSGEASKSSTFGYTENTVTISMDAETSPSKDAAPVKEAPLWMTQSTVDGAAAAVDEMGDSSAYPSMAWPQANRHPKTEDIMKTLLAHEKKGPSIKIPTGHDETTSSDSEDEKMSKPAPSVSVAADTMESDDDDDVTPMVSIGSQKVALSDVTEDMVSQMTQEEKEEYIRLGQEMYASMYD